MDIVIIGAEDLDLVDRRLGELARMSRYSEAEFLEFCLWTDTFLRIITLVKTSGVFSDQQLFKMSKMLMKHYCLASSLRNTSKRIFVGTVFG